MITHPVIERRRAPWQPTDIGGTVLYLPLYSPMLFGDSFISRDACGHLCTVTGALWTPQGRKFDGSDDKIVIPDHAALDLTDAITIMAWVRTTDVTRAYQCVVAKRPGATEYNYYLRIDSGYLRFAFYNAAHLGLTDNTTILVNNTWVLAGATYDKSNIRLYQNGSEVKNVAQTTAMVADAGTLDIGLFTYLAGPDFYALSGDVGEVWIYNRALNPIEIQRVHHLTKWRYQ